MKFVPCVLLLATLSLAGCQRQAADDQTKAGDTAAPIIVSTVTPKVKDLRKVIEQPAQIEGFEETPLFARVPGYVGLVRADIGMPFFGPKLDSEGNVEKSGEILAQLSVPELVQEHEQKMAFVKQTEADALQAKAAVAAAEAHVETAAARIIETAAAKERVDASYERWNREYVRLNDLVGQKVIDEQSRDEALNQREAADAARKELNAKVVSAQAIHKETEALRDKSKADFTAAEARVHVAKAEEKRALAWLEYADIRAPYDCEVVRRNIHKGHFLQPGAGSGSQPLFVVTRTDKLRVVIDIPEAEAGYLKQGQPGFIRLQNVKERDYKGPVARLSAAVDAKSRTLRVEIDLDRDKEDKVLRPGMYAYVTFHVPLEKRLTLPAAAVVTTGDKAFCWQIVNGKATRTPLRIGLREGGVVEVIKKQASDGSQSWVDMTTEDAVIVSNLGNLTEGQAVALK